ncbi:hypothetical protein CVT26_005060 [Gymnopilus dilepis]|uniref:Uncharacterized protein n=1 Tax=Gymnopilus dilepis TaxID=231916 RepID=A0A409X4W7_9AGAR|nr:hypothetical protein CVT26_005060 [Gymnopilus dilepis]
MYAPGTFMGASGSSDPNKQGGGGTGTTFQLEERAHFGMEVAVATGAMPAIKDDAIPMCEKELLVVRIGGGARRAEERSTLLMFLIDFTDSMEDTATVCKKTSSLRQLQSGLNALFSSCLSIFVLLLNLTADSFEVVATNAQTIVEYIMALLFESPFTRPENTS